MSINRRLIGVCHWFSFKRFVILKPEKSFPPYISIKFLSQQFLKSCYLGLHLDKRLTWNLLTRLKQTELNHMYRMLTNSLYKTNKNYTILCRLQNGLTDFKYSYMELRIKRTNLNRIQSLQSKIPILKAPFYNSNFTIHTDLKISFVSAKTKNSVTSNFTSNYLLILYPLIPSSLNLNSSPKTLLDIWGNAGRATIWIPEVGYAESQ